MFAKFSERGDLSFYALAQDKKDILNYFKSKPVSLKIPEENKDLDFGIRVVTGNDDSVRASIISFAEMAMPNLLAPIIESLGQSDDLIIAVKRKEVQNMLENQMNPIKISRIIWVPRLIGFLRWMKVVRRIILAKKHLRNIQSVVSIGAPIEILFGPRSARRIYITDTEPNLAAHRLARKKATDIVIPQHFKDELAPILFDTKATIHRLNGLHGHIHLNPSTLRKKPNTPYKVLARKIRGNGGHDRNEWVPISDKIFTGLEVISVDLVSFLYR